MMKIFGKIRKVHIIALLVLIIYSFALAGIVQAVGTAAEPGSDQNPLVAKDYVDDAVGKIGVKINDISTANTQLNGTVTQLSSSVAQLTAQVEELKKQIGELTAKNDELSKRVEELAASPAGSPAATALKDVKIPAGKQLIGSENTEFILISGKAVVVSGSGSGLLNESTGTFAVKGAVIAKNNVMLVIKADGRGFKAVTETRVLIRGSYSIK